MSHRSVQAVLVALVIFLGWVGWSVGQALTTPGNGTISTKLAEWARDHYLGPVVTLGEWLTYQPPKVGGKPQFALTAPTSGSGAGVTRPKTGPAAITPNVPARLSSPAGAPLPGEGQWRVLASVKGVPAIYGTYLRAGQRAHLVRGRHRVDGPAPAYVPAPPGRGRSRAGQLGLLAVTAAELSAPGWSPRSTAASSWTPRAAASTSTGTPGHPDDGRRVARLLQGRAGRHRQLGTGRADEPGVLGVRQNLKLIVDHGEVPATVDQNVQTQWGATLGGGYYVWRSGSASPVTGGSSGSTARPCTCGHWLSCCSGPGR